MSKAIFQSLMIEPQQPGLRIIALPGLLITEQVHMCFVSQVIPLTGAETLVQEVHPVSGDINVPGDKPVDGHGEREIDDHVDLASLGKGFNGHPVQMWAIWIQERNAARKGGYMKSPC